MPDQSQNQSDDTEGPVVTTEIGIGDLSFPDMERGIRHFFAPDGPLAAVLPGYEERPEQTDMALAIAAALGAGQKLIAEAGTGTGKTLAYLVPALASGVKVVISTGTKNLQEQILKNDIPLIERATDRQFDVAVMKGRNNYLCEARFERATQQLDLPTVGERAMLTEIRNWRETTHTGDRAELEDLPDDSRLWPQLSVSSEQCTGRKCSLFDTCWVTTARRRAQECQLLVVNHHLYFADAALRERVGGSGVAVLPRSDYVIFDEAHEIDEIAAQFFGYQVTEWRFRDLGQDIGRCASLTSEPALAGRCNNLITQLDVRTRSLFDSLPFDRSRTELKRSRVDVRVRDFYTMLDTTLRELEALLAGVDDDVAPALRRRAAQLAAELAFVLYEPARSSLLGEVELQREQDGRLDRHDPSSYDPYDQSDPLAESDPERSPDNAADRRVPFVRYTEGFGRRRALVARPLEIAPLMVSALGDLPAIFTSATLATDGNFNHFKRRLGVVEAQEMIGASPFDYVEQTRLYLPNDLPDVNNSSFATAAPALVAELVNAAGGGAFVLCTSNRVLDIMASAIRGMTTLTLLAQGSAPRSHLIERFRNDGNAVLVATTSFWRGVDVPGSALRLVVIDRLPFASPGDPIVAARLDYLRECGESPFRSYQIPQATLMLRQGFGRLIRSRSDRGMVAILDSRISKKSYGRLFLRSLPDCPRLHERADATAYLQSIAPTS